MSKPEKKINFIFIALMGFFFTSEEGHEKLKFYGKEDFETGRLSITS